MQYAKARKKSEENEFIYKVYLTDSLKSIGNLNVRYIELIDDGKWENTKSASEIIDDVKNHLDVLGRM